jgi:hypothetical protein
MSHVEQNENIPAVHPTGIALWIATLLTEKGSTFTSALRRVQGKHSHLPPRERLAHQREFNHQQLGRTPWNYSSRLRTNLSFHSPTTCFAALTPSQNLSSVREGAVVKSTISRKHLICRSSGSGRSSARGGQSSCVGFPARKAESEQAANRLDRTLRRVRQPMTGRADCSVGSRSWRVWRGTRESLFQTALQTVCAAMQLSHCTKRIAIYAHFAWLISPGGPRVFLTKRLHYLEFISCTKL